MIHHPPMPRTDNPKTPITQNASIQPIMLEREAAGEELATVSAGVVPGATMRGKSPVGAALLMVMDPVSVGPNAGARISHANVSTAAPSIASSAAIASTYRASLVRRANAMP